MHVSTHTTTHAGTHTQTVHKFETKPPSLFMAAKDLNTDSSQLIPVSQQLPPPPTSPPHDISDPTGLRGFPRPRVPWGLPSIHSCSCTLSQRLALRALPSRLPAHRFLSQMLETTVSNSSCQKWSTEADWTTSWPAAHKNTFAGSRQNTAISWCEVALKFVRPLLVATSMFWKGTRWWEKYQAFEKRNSLYIQRNWITILR